MAVRLCVKGNGGNQRKADEESEKGWLAINTRLYLGNKITTEY